MDSRGETRDRADMGKGRGRDGQKDGQWIKERLICLCYDLVAPCVVRVSRRTGAVLFSFSPSCLFGGGGGRGRGREGSKIGRAHV